MNALPQNIERIEYATVMPIADMRDLAIAKVESLHEALDALPKNPYGDNTPTLNQLKTTMQISDNQNDFSMFLAGSVEMGLSSLFAGALGLSGIGAQALDVATSATSQNMAQKQSQKTTFTRAANANSSKSVFSAAAKKPEFKRAPQPNAGPQTSIAKKAATNAAKKKQFAAYKATLHKRQKLERKLLEVGTMIEYLNDLRKDSNNAGYAAMTADGMSFDPLTNSPKNLVHIKDKRLQNTVEQAAQYGIQLDQTQKNALRLTM